MSTTCSASRRASYLVLRMHVVVASHQPLPAKGYGGPQRVIVALVRGLAALGHRITLLAPPTTRVPEATVVAVPPRKLADPATLAPYVPRDAAIVHTHFPLRSAPGSFPFVQTVHRNLKPGAPSYPNSIFLSRDHARRHNSEVFVYNGLDPADYVFRRFPRRPSQYDLFLGALHSAKGYHWAVEAAKRSGHRLIVAGGWRPSFTGSISSWVRWTAPPRRRCSRVPGACGTRPRGTSRLGSSRSKRFSRARRCSGPTVERSRS